MGRLGGLLLLLTGCVAPTAGQLNQAVGEVQSGFPNPWERALLMAANRARADPATVKGPASAIYPAGAPLVVDFDLSRSARFHATTLEKGKAPLMHPSPCVLRSDVGTSGCDGTPSCACSTGQTCQSCGQCPDGTDPFTRIGYFFRGAASGEIAAAGYGDPFGVMDGWVDEAAGSDGHRQIVDGDAGQVGFGHSEGASDACWDTFDVGDFADGASAPAHIASAAPNPIGGQAGAYQIYASWNDPAAGAPRSLAAVVDGKCTTMTRELGDDKLNASYLAKLNLDVGCHSVYILGSDAAGAHAAYPTTTAFTINAGAADCPDELPQPAADCDPSFAPADLGTTPASKSDLGQPPSQNPSSPQNPASPPQAGSNLQGGCSTAPGQPNDTVWLLLLVVFILRRRRLPFDSEAARG